MPYHDPHRAFVNEWFASTEASNWSVCETALHERHLDRLAESRGACILYTHFGHGYVREDGTLQPRFAELMRRLAAMNGWFVPVRELLDHLRPSAGPHTLTNSERSRLERHWLSQKVFRGTS
jgi:hypothetical protein